MSRVTHKFSTCQTTMRMWGVDEGCEGKFSAKINYPWEWAGAKVSQRVNICSGRRCTVHTCPLPRSMKNRERSRTRPLYLNLTPPGTEHGTRGRMLLHPVPFSGVPDGSAAILFLPLPCLILSRTDKSGAAREDKTMSPSHGFTF
jgi:hypothetical protein